VSGIAGHVDDVRQYAGLRGNESALAWAAAGVFDAFENVCDQNIFHAMSLLKLLHHTT
jgi:hypothetical protein